MPKVPLEIVVIVAIAAIVIVCFVFCLFREAIRKILNAFAEKLGRSRAVKENPNGTKWLPEPKRMIEDKESEYIEKELELIEKRKISALPQSHEREELQSLADITKRQAKEKEYLKCERNLTRYVDLTPEDEVLLVEIVAIYLEQQEVRRAVSLLETYEENFNKKKRFYKAIAHATRALPDKQAAEKKALQALSKALELFPNNSDLLSSLGYTQWFFGNVQDAAQTTKKALENANNENEVMWIKNNLAFYYAELGDIIHESEARKYAKECCEKCDKNSERLGYYLDTLGYVKLKFAREVRDIDDALTSFLEAGRLGFPLEIVAEHIKQAELKRRELPITLP